LLTGVGEFGKTIIQGAVHGIAQGTMSMMQGGKFLIAGASGFFGNLGAYGFGKGMTNIGLGEFAESTVGTILSGAVLGGAGSVMTGGNFWEGAVIGGIVAGLNHAMHKMEAKSPKDITILNASDGAGGKGHSGLIIGNDKDGYIYIASDGRVDSSGSAWMGGKNDGDIQIFKTKQDALAYAKTKYNYDDSITIKTNSKQDLTASKRAIIQLQSNYHFLWNNCNHIISAALTGAGLSSLGGGSIVPNLNFLELKSNFQKK